MFNNHKIHSDPKCISLKNKCEHSEEYKNPDPNHDLSTEPGLRFQLLLNCTYVLGRSFVDQCPEDLF